MWESLRKSPLGRLSVRKSLRFATALIVACFVYIIATSQTTHAADSALSGNSITYNNSASAYAAPPLGAHIVQFAAAPTPATGGTSCALEGIGWIVCPLTKAIATGMDYVFKLIDGYLEVRPLQTDTDNPMYRMWSVMRNLANVAFIIAFLVVIYSQVVGGGLTNYSVKRILPRIIIAAILVNTSYWICAVAIDIFNILGYSLNGMFIGMRNNLVGPGGNNWQLFSWESVFGFILSGGTVAAAGAIGVTLAAISMGGISVMGLIMLLLPVVLGLLLVILVTFLILAARQAILTVLVVVAPLAFVAYLLPNTEKWFDKWRSLFFTLLIIFPAFAMIFGAAQLAGALIIQNAKEINMVILGMAVQVAPLAITPLLLKLGGGVLNRFAGIVNNPGKGLMDRTKSFSKDRLGGISAASRRQTREMAQNGTLRRRNIARRYAVHEENRRMDREGTKSADEAQSKGMYSHRREAQTIYARLQEAKETQQLGDTYGQTLWEQRAATTGAIRYQRLQQQESSTIGEGYKKSWEREVSEINAGNNPYALGTAAHALAARSYDATQELAIQAMALQAAKNQQQVTIARALQNDIGLRTRAGGIDPNGAVNAYAAAKSVISKMDNEAIGNIKSASSIAPGDTASLRTEITAAMRAGNEIAMRAYTDMLAEAGDPGIATLREVIKDVDSGTIALTNDQKTTLKFQINGNDRLNGAAKDIGNWSRDATNSKSLQSIIDSPSTWASMSSAKWSGLEESSQLEALGFTTNPANPSGPRLRTRPGAITREAAIDIMDGPAFQNLKTPVKDEIKRIAI